MGDGAIHTCVNNSTGAMREVSHLNHCRSYEHAVDLGGPGISGYEIVTSIKFIDAGDIATGFATCPAGKKVLGGGGHFPLVHPDIALTDSFPGRGSDGPDTVWLATMRNSHPVATGTLTTYAVCANVAP